MISTDALSFLIFLFLPALPCLAFLKPLHAFLAAPIASAVTAAVAALIVTWISLPIAFVWSVMCLSALAVVLGFEQSRTAIRSNLRRGANAFEYACITVASIFMVLLCGRVPAPLAWDARSIWLFHASWFMAPIRDLQAVYSLESLVFSHPDYPPLGPASIATLWQLAFRDEHLRMGVILLAALPIFLLALATVRLGGVVSRVGGRQSSSYALLLLFPIGTALSDGLIDKGYMDVIVATSVLLVTVLIFERLTLGPSREVNLLLAIGALFACLAKQEGLLFVGVSLVAAILVDRKRARFPALLMLALPLPLLFWRFTVAHFGYSSPGDASGVISNLGELTSVQSIGWRNIRLIIDQYSANVFVPMSVLLVIGLMLFFGKDMPRVGRRIALFSSIVWCGQTSIILLTYALGGSRIKLEWWLSTSFDRIIATPWAHIAVVLCLAIAFSFPTDELHRRSLERSVD